MNDKMNECTLTSSKSVCEGPMLSLLGIWDESLSQLWGLCICLLSISPKWGKHQKNFTFAHDFMPAPMLATVSWSYWVLNIYENTLKETKINE